MIQKLKSNERLKRLALFLRCIVKFGLNLGFTIFTKLNEKDTSILPAVNLPGYSHPIYLRPGTSDASIFNTVFIKLRFNKIKEQRKPKFIIDAGANIGLVSLFLANKYPDAIIYAVEPESSNYGLLVKNTKCSHSIFPIQAALWKNNDPLSIENEDVEKWAFRVSENENNGRKTVKTVTVSDLLSMAKMETIDIFKIDIEGAEKDVFSENYEQWIDKVDILIIELHEHLNPGSRETFYKALDGLSYQEIIHGENHYIFKNE